MRKLQLIYFNLRALCEAPRMMLHNAEIEYSYEMAAYADSIFESAHDLFLPLNPTINVWVGDMHLKNKKVLIEKILPKAFNNFEKLLDKYEGKFFLGDRVFYCDYNVYHHISLALILDKNILDNYTNLKRFMSDFEKIKGISEYLNSRPKLIDIGTWPKVIIDGIEYTSGTNPDYKYL